MEVSSFSLIEEATKISESSFWRLVVEEIAKERNRAREACWSKRGDRAYEQGMAEAFDIVLGRRDMVGIFQRVLDRVEKRGVADKVPNK